MILIIVRLYYTIVNGFQYAEVCGVRDKKYFDMNESFNDLFNNMMNVHINNEQKREKKKQGRRSEKKISFSTYFFII